MEYRIRGRIMAERAATDIVVRDGRIAQVSLAGRGKADFGSRDSWIIPPLFDVQVNGIRGLDLQSPTLRAETVAEVSAALASTGVACWSPTLITGPARRMEQACRAIADAMVDKDVARAIAGIHLEGPHISPTDGPRGAHAKQYVRKPDIALFDRLYDAARGKILYVTVAPEWPGSSEYIRHVTGRGVVVSLGHHNGSTDDIARAVDAGATLCTHLGNGLASMINRHHNVLWPQLVEDRLAASLIPDLEHLPAAVMKAFVRAKGPSRIVLTSDSVHIAGLPPGDYDLGGQPAQLLPSGRVCLKGTDLLAGSSLQLLQGVVNVVETGVMPLDAAVASATTVPARLFGAKLDAGLPAAGRRAHFVAFDVMRDSGRARANIRTVFINGRQQA